MKKLIINNKLIRFVFVLLVMANFISCEEEEETTIENPYIIQGSAEMIYESITTYSYKQNMTTAEPQFDFGTTVYSFSILSVNLNGAEMTSGLSVFTIDSESGVISINNTSGNLMPGSSYNFNVGIGNVNGIIKNEDAFILTVLDIPLDYSITNTSYTANFLENVDVATVSYQDTSTNGDVLSDISYSLVGAPVGFSINADTGVISKNSSASSGTHVLSVSIDSNLGAKTFTDILTVTVGEAPTINYLQNDGVTELSKVVLSPWTAYTTAIPVIDGMNAAGYEIILPATLTAGSVIANSDGSISVLADQNLALVDHSIGIIATNDSGISATFNNVFTLSVEIRWEASPVFFEDFNTAPDPAIAVNAFNAALNAYKLNSSAFDFVVQNITAKNVYIAKMGEGKVGGNFASPVDAALVLELTMQTDWRKMRVAFNEGFGYGDNRLGWYERTLSSSHDISDLLTSTFDNSNWTTIMASNDASWSGSSVWSGLSDDSQLNQVPFKEVEIVPGNASVFLNWRVQKTGTATAGSVFLVDNIKVEVSTAFAAEEQ